jgi:hypothetical protein
MITALDAESASDSAAAHVLTGGGHFYYFHPQPPEDLSGKLKIFRAEELAVTGILNGDGSGKSGLWLNQAGFESIPYPAEQWGYREGEFCSEALRENPGEHICPGGAQHKNMFGSHLFKENLKLTGNFFDLLVVAHSVKCLSTAPI